MKRILATLFLSTALIASARAEVRLHSPCPTGGGYPEALCRYERGDYRAAEPLFATIVEREEQAPETLKAEYFLARTRMRLQRFSEASAGLMNIYGRDASFYHEWGCDYLLGECRKAMGLGE